MGRSELHAVIACCSARQLAHRLRNGYKDQSYIELALLAQKVGKRIFVVVEKAQRNGASLPGQRS